MSTLHPSCIHILCWSLKRSVKLELGPAPPFPPMRVLEVLYRSRALSLVCGVALSATSRESPPMMLEICIVPKPYLAGCVEDLLLGTLGCDLKEIGHLKLISSSSSWQSFFPKQFAVGS